MHRGRGLRLLPARMRKIRHDSVGEAHLDTPPTLIKGGRCSVGRYLFLEQTRRSNGYYEWFLHRAYILYGGYAIADRWAATFKEFPPIQKPNSFTIDEALGMLTAAATGGSN